MLNTFIFSVCGPCLLLDAPGYSVTPDTNTIARLGLTPLKIAKTMRNIFLAGLAITLFPEGRVRYPITLEGISLPWTFE